MLFRPEICQVSDYPDLGGEWFSPTRPIDGQTVNPVEAFCSCAVVLGVSVEVEKMSSERP